MEHEINPSSIERDTIQTATARLETCSIKTVLVVDYEAEFINMITRDLKRKGFSMHSAYNEAEACHKISSAAQKGVPFDLAIIDVDMPQMGGFKFLERVKAVKSTTSVLVVSQFHNTTIINELIRPELDACCLKPITPQELMDIISLIGKKRGQRL